MKSNAHRRLDAFTFSLGGVSVASSFAAIPVVADNSITKAWDARLSGVEGAKLAPRNAGRLWSILLQHIPHRTTV